MSRYRRAESLREKRYRMLVGGVVGLVASLVIIAMLALWAAMSDGELPGAAVWVALAALGTVAVVAEWKVGTREVEDDQ